jgi:DNA-binding IclR family transcriptional regulator
MDEPSSHAGDVRLERAIILQLLAGEYEHGCSSAELAAAVGVEPAAAMETLTRLRTAGIVELSGHDVAASVPLLRLDQLGLIAI